MDQQTFHSISSQYGSGIAKLNREFNEDNAYVQITTIVHFAYVYQ